jgi:hypothetical protein
VFPPPQHDQDDHNEDEQQASQQQIGHVTRFSTFRSLATANCRAARSGQRRAQGACGSLTEPGLTAGADGGGTIGPMSPSGASSRSTITGAWSLGPVPLRACRSTQAARTRLATGEVASYR